MAVSITEKAQHGTSLSDPMTFSAKSRHDWCYCYVLEESMKNVKPKAWDIIPWVHYFQ